MSPTLSHVHVQVDVQWNPSIVDTLGIVPLLRKGTVMWRVEPLWPLSGTHNFLGHFNDIVRFSNRVNCKIVTVGESVIFSALMNGVCALM